MIAPSKQSEKTKPKASVPVGRMVIWSAVALLLTGAVATFSILVSRERHELNKDDKGKSSLIVDASPAKAPPQPVATPVTAPPERTELEKPPFEKRPGAMQLPNGKVLTFPAPKPGEIRKVYAYGHMYECDSEGNFRDITPRKLFHTAFEGNFLGLAIEDKPFIPAFLKGLDQNEVRKILEKNEQPIGDETDGDWAQLKAYDDMRCAALQYMEEGGTFDEFVDYFANQVKKERQTQALCLREVMTLYKGGKIAEAREMAEAAAALKERQGLKAFKLPPHVLEAFDAL